MQPDVKARLLVYLGLLEKWQKSVNLVSPGTIPEAWERHFEDSLQVLEFIPDGAETIVDIGSGAGFPGLVLGIARRDLDVHLVDSDSKKTTFLSVVSRETGAKNVTVHTGRIEQVLPDLKADLITARALAPLETLLSLTESQWGHARFVFLKGADSQKEIDQARGNYDFELEAHTSQTSENARILCISQVSKKRAA